MKIKKKRRITNHAKHILGHYFANYKVGDSFYTNKEDRHITAFATYYERSVITERMYAVTIKTGKLERLLKVTFIK